MENVIYTTDEIVLSDEQIREIESTIPGEDLNENLMDEGD